MIDISLFNSREIATAIWLAPLVVVILWSSTGRGAVKSIVLIFFHARFLVTLALMLGYVVAEAVLLISIDAWHVGLLKDTTLWICLTGFALLLNTITSTQNENVFAAVLRDNVKVILFVTFLINTYTLPLFCELILVPSLMLLKALAAYAYGKEEYGHVGLIVDGVLAAVGIALLVWSAWVAISDWHNLAQVETLRKFVLPILLTILFTPYLYAAVLVSAYQTAFVRLRIGPEKDSKVVRYAKRRILRVFAFKLAKLQTFNMQSA